MVRRVIGAERRMYLSRCVVCCIIVAVAFLSSASAFSFSLPGSPLTGRRLRPLGSQRNGVALRMSGSTWGNWTTETITGHFSSRELIQMPGRMRTATFLSAYTGVGETALSLEKIYMSDSGMPFENDMKTSRMEAIVVGKIIIDEFVLRKQPEAKVLRIAIGGGSPQAAMGARLWSDRVGLVAPVGQDFNPEMLSELEMFCDVDTSGVQQLKGFVTPRNQIRYEKERMLWTPGEGWDRWEDLNRQILPIPDHYEKSGHVHVVTEGGGGADGQMAWEYKDRNHDVTMSVEPVMHTVSEGAVESLAPITRVADCVCPDWETAVKMSRLSGCPHLNVQGSWYHSKHMGVFTRTGDTFEGRPVYTNGMIFMYHVNSKQGGTSSRWYVGPEVGSEVSYLYVDSDAVTPDLITAMWHEWDTSRGLWTIVDSFNVARTLGDVGVVATNGDRLHFRQEHGHMRVWVNGSFGHDINEMCFDGRFGQITDDTGRHERATKAASLRELCAQAGVVWKEKGEQAKPWTEVDYTLVVAGHQQSVWRAVVEEESGGIYYWNTITDETLWERPPELLRCSEAQSTTRGEVRNVRGDTSVFSLDDKSEEDEAASDHELTETPEIVLPKCALRLGLTKGVLVVRRGAMGSYLLDCKDLTRVYHIPAVKVPVVDPTGAGNAYSAALGVNVGRLAKETQNYTEAVIRAACRASATGASIVSCEGLPILTDTLLDWLKVESEKLVEKVTWKLTPLGKRLMLDNKVPNYLEHITKAHRPTGQAKAAGLGIVGVLDGPWGLRKRRAMASGHHAGGDGYLQSL